MLFAYIEYLRSQSVEARKRLVWWYTSACTLAVVLVWLGVLVLGDNPQYRLQPAQPATNADQVIAERASARERLQALRAEVGYPTLPTVASTTSDSVGEIAQPPTDYTDTSLELQEAPPNSEPTPIATTSAPTAVPAAPTAPTTPADI